MQPEYTACRAVVRTQKTTWRVAILAVLGKGGLFLYSSLLFSSRLAPAQDQRGLFN